jgi:archaemetzincin
MLSFGHFEKGFLEKILEAVMLEFNCDANIKEVRMDLSEFFDPVRRQYNGDKLLRTINSMDIPEATKIIGLFNVDIYIPILTYIFGQAQLGGRTAIASHYRLSNERYGMQPDQDLLLARLKKEVIHELGHTFGLIHCHTTDCVMRSSTYVEDIDLKDMKLCAKCRAGLGEELNLFI